MNMQHIHPSRVSTPTIALANIQRSRDRDTFQFSNTLTVVYLGWNCNHSRMQLHFNVRSTLQSTSKLGVTCRATY